MTSSQHNDPIKSETNSYPLDPLGEPQPQQEKVHKRHKMKVVFLTVLLGLVCATQEDETVRSASKVPGTVWSGRRSCVCVCVCVCVCTVFLGFLCWSISKLCPSHATLLHLLALYLFCLVYHLSCVLTDLCIFTALVTEKEDQPTAVGFEILDLTSEINLSQKCLLLLWLQLLPYFINSALFSQVRQCVLICTRGGKLKREDSGWNKKTRRKISKVNFLLAFRRLESHTHCIPKPSKYRDSHNLLVLYYILR